MGDQQPIDVESLKRTANNMANSVSNGVGSVLSTSSEGIKNAFANMAQSSGIIIGLIIVIVVAAICAVIIYWIIVNNVFQKQSSVIEETKVPINGNTTSIIPIAYMPLSQNGFRRTMTFWIYLNDMNNANGNYKRVMFIGAQNEAINTVSPMIFLGKNKNEMHIRFARMSSDNGPNGQYSLNMSDSQMNTFMKQGVTIEYLPMQRWVHIGIVVTENVNGGVIQAYVDSDLAVVVSNKDKFVGVDKSTNLERDINNLNLDKLGTIVIGGSGSGGEDFGFNGLVSKVTIYNYDLNARDIYNNYSEGPIDGMLTALGYGVRSPIYKLSNT